MNLFHPERRFLGWILIVGLMLCATHWTRADAAVVQEVQQKVDAKQYADALAQITAALDKIKPMDESPDRYPLLMLRGESLLQIGQRTLALKAFETAQRCAPGPREAALARAHVVLLKVSSTNQYQPKTKGAEPINILDPQSRKQAFAAVREDMAKKLQPQLASAMDATSLTPMLDIVPSMLDLGYLEYAATGAAEESRAQLKELGGRARELINGELKRIHHQINAWETAANSWANESRRGLYSNEAAQAQQTLNYLKRIEQTSRDVRRQAIELGFDGAPWEPIIADSADQADRLQALLNINN